MIQSAFVSFLLAISILLQECDIGNLMDLVVTFDVTVKNASARTGFVRIELADVARGSFVKPGKSVSVTSFGGGKFTIIVLDYDPATNAALVKLKSDLEAKLANPSGLSPAEAKALAEQLKTTEDQLVRRTEFAAAGVATCSGTLKPGDPPRDQSVAATATSRGVTWGLQGCP